MGSPSTDVVEGRLDIVSSCSDVEGERHCLVFAWILWRQDLISSYSDVIGERHRLVFAYML